jgi:hypothetical protein
MKMKEIKLQNINRWLVAAPWVTVGLLMGMSLLLPNRSSFSPDTEKRKALVAHAMKSAPFFIGRWVGQDAAHLIPREAQTLLHPNALLSRTYRSPAGPTVQILIVHCGDARDMIGHYPPICYPSAGWLALPDSSRDMTLSVNGATLPARHYEFQCISEQRRVETIRVFNAFILPGGRAALDIDDINRQSERLALSVQGVAQLQVITSASAPIPQAIEAANEILGGMPELFDALGLGSPSGSPMQGASS